MAVLQHREGTSRAPHLDWLRPPSTHTPLPFTPHPRLTLHLTTAASPPTFHRPPRPPSPRPIISLARSPIHDPPNNPTHPHLAQRILHAIPYCGDKLKLLIPFCRKLDTNGRGQPWSHAPSPSPAGRAPFETLANLEPSGIVMSKVTLLVLCTAPAIRHRQLNEGAHIA